MIWEDQSGRKQRPEQVVDMIELSNDPFVGAFLVNDKNFDRQARAKSLLSCNSFAWFSKECMYLQRCHIKQLHCLNFPIKKGIWNATQGNIVCLKDSIQVRTQSPCHVAMPKTFETLHAMRRSPMDRLKSKIVVPRFGESSVDSSLRWENTSEQRWPWQKMARLCALENKGPLKTSLSQTKVNEQLYQRDVDYEYVLIARQSLFPRFEILDPRPMTQWKKREECCKDSSRTAVESSQKARCRDDVKGHFLYFFRW